MYVSELSRSCAVYAIFIHRYVLLHKDEDSEKNGVGVQNSVQHNTTEKK